MSAQVRYSTTHPLWKIEALQKHCKWINMQRGSRKERYCNLLSLFNEAIDHSTARINWVELRERVSAIAHEMPYGIKEKEEIRDFICKLSDSLFEHSYSKALPEKELAQGFIKVRNALIEASTSSEVKSFFYENCGRAELRHLKSLSEGLEKNSPLKDKINKLYNFGVDKLSTLLYIERSQIFPDQDVKGKTSLLTRHSQHSIYPVLSIDGGGIRGIIPATMLTYIEAVTREKTANLFKLIGGTSTGGILALGLATPLSRVDKQPHYSAQELLDLYILEHSQIFRHNDLYQEHTDWPLLKRIQNAVKTPKYFSPSDFFATRFADFRMSDAVTDVVITANHINSILESPNVLFNIPKRVHLFTKNGLIEFSSSYKNLQLAVIGKKPFDSIFDLRDKEVYVEVEGKQEPISSLLSSSKRISTFKKRDFFMREVAQITSAAPTYFEPFSINAAEAFMDGGILQNNPTIPCIFEAEKKKVGNQFVLSLGTGGVLDRPIARAIRNCSNFWMDLFANSIQPESKEDSVTRQLLPHGAYYRFQYDKFEEDALPNLDDCSPQTINTLVESGKSLVEDNTDELREICKVLKPESL